MTQPYLGEIRLFAGNFAPRTNALCTGQLLSITQNSALFSLIGTYYGGNGTTNFALPDLRGRLPVGMGQGPGLSNYTIGEQTGSETVTITTQTMPAHTHFAYASTQDANSASPVNNYPATLVNPPWTKYWVPDASKTGAPLPLSTNALSMAGGSQPHNNLMPILAVTAIIALQGVFPTRN
jgi:microcystin-dependent protein